MRSVIFAFLMLLSANAFAQTSPSLQQIIQDTANGEIKAATPETPTENQDETATPDNTAKPDAAADAAAKVEAAKDAAVVKAPQAANTNTPPSTTPDAPAVPVYEKQKFAVLQTLDKMTARTATVTVPVGQPTALGPLFVDIKTCQKTPPTELPESSAFLQIWEAKPKPKLKKKVDPDPAEPPSQWVFSGWMFASSPALSAMDHPVYDVWLKDCVNETAVAKSK